MSLRPSQIALSVTVAAVFLFGSLSSAGAQPLGSFTWQLQPFCNVVSVNVIQQGGIYTLDGFDDQCGATTRAPVVGTAVPNLDGTVNLGLTIVTTPGGGNVHVSGVVNVVNFNGSWSDSSGHAGTFAFGQHAGGAPRPAPGGVAMYEFPGVNFPTAVYGTFEIPVPLAVANRSAWSVQMYFPDIQRYYVVPGFGTGGSTNYRMSIGAGATPNSTRIYIDKVGSGEVYSVIRIFRTTP